MKEHFFTKDRICFLSHRSWPVFLLPLVFLLLPIVGFSQNCSVNSGTPETICPDEPLFLYGQTSGLFSGDGTTTWSQVSGPSATIVSPNDLTTQVTNLIPGSTYVFRISNRCQDGSLVFQDVTKTVSYVSQAEISTPGFTACPGTHGPLTANTPETNETGSWSLPAGSNGVEIDNPNNPSTTLTFADNACGETIVRWTITNTVSGCSSFADVVVINRGGVEPVTASTPNPTLSHCYSTTQSTTLNGSFAGCSAYGQQGVWTVISGPNVPNIANPNSNNTNVSNLIEGTYRFRWTVTGTCASGFDEVDIVVPAPTADLTGANAGSNQTFCDNRTSTVLTGNAPLYINEDQWTQISGFFNTCLFD